MTASRPDPTDVDRARAAQVLAEEIAGWPLGSGYYQYTITSDDAREIADHLVSDALPELLAAERESALAPVLALADELEDEAMYGEGGTQRRDAATRIRAAAALAPEGETTP